MNSSAATRELIRHTTLTKWQIMEALNGTGAIVINGVHCTLSSVQREDGSGNSFNLEVRIGNEKYKVYARADN